MARLPTRASSGKRAHRGKQPNPDRGTNSGRGPSISEGRLGFTVTAFTSRHLYEPDGTLNQEKFDPFATGQIWRANGGQAMAW